MWGSALLPKRRIHLIYTQQKEVPGCINNRASFPRRSFTYFENTLQPDISRSLWIIGGNTTDCMNRVLLEKLTDIYLVKKFPAFHGTQRFITAITKARYLSLSWVRWIQNRPVHSTFRWSILILPSHLRLCFPSGPFPPDFLTVTLYAPLFSPIRICGNQTRKKSPH